MSYRVEGAPRHVLDGDGAPLPGHYEAGFVTEAGTRVGRFLTDKGRAWLLAALEQERRELTQDELDEHTVEPDLDALLARMERESGEGA